MLFDDVPGTVGGDESADSSDIEEQAGNEGAAPAGEDRPVV